jgi:hypothetical protein
MVLGTIGTILGTIGTILGAVLGTIGAVLGTIGAVLGTIGAVLSAFAALGVALIWPIRIVVGTTTRRAHTRRSAPTRTGGAAAAR